MDLRDSYARQVRLLMAALPHVAKESCFALKGGTAINLFVQDFPRLSVDIDLAYKAYADRDTDLAAINDALMRITESLNGRQGITAIRQENKVDEKRIIVNTADAQIKIEVSLVWRGLLLPATEMPVCEKVEIEYGFTTRNVVSLADLYSGKICAALDRQDPRDLFDVLNMLENAGVTDQPTTSEVGMFFTPLYVNLTPRITKPPHFKHQSRVRYHLFRGPNLWWFCFSTTHLNV